MKPGPQTRLSLPSQFHGLLLELAEHAERDLLRIPWHPQRAIHALRTRMKKLLAILRLVGERVPPRVRQEIIDRAKRLKGAFSVQRDAEVAAGLCGELGAKPLKHKSPSRSSQRHTPPLIIEAAELRQIIAATMLDGLDRSDLRDAYVDTYRAGRQGMKACLDDCDPALLHHWRKPVKEFYYQSLVFHALKGMKRRIRRARKLGRWLGRHHDWRLLADRAGAGGQKKTVRRIKKKRAQLRRRIFKLAEKLYALTPKELARMLEQGKLRFDLHHDGPCNVKGRTAPVQVFAPE